VRANPAGLGERERPCGDRQPAAAASGDDDPAAAPGDLRGEVEALLRADEVVNGVDLATGVRREDVRRRARSGRDAVVGADLRGKSRRARSTSTASTRTADVARSTCTAR
jgi:hypothetical protein